MIVNIRDLLLQALELCEPPAPKKKTLNEIILEGQASMIAASDKVLSMMDTARFDHRRDGAAAQVNGLSQRGNMSGEAGIGQLGGLYLRGCSQLGIFNNG
tara:strand:+ start:15100 stop:15399 length:300 start_codon:yes stop_codon:yes gene_type:complete